VKFVTDARYKHSYKWTKSCLQVDSCKHGDCAIRRGLSNTKEINNLTYLQLKTINVSTRVGFYPSSPSTSAEFHFVLIVNFVTSSEYDYV
jgi:hypothetical protein